MPKTFLRCFALLLLPGLMGDAFAQSALSTPSNSRRAPFLTVSLHSQAIVPSTWASPSMDRSISKVYQWAGAWWGNATYIRNCAWIETPVTLFTTRALAGYGLATLNPQVWQNPWSLAGLFLVSGVAAGCFAYALFRLPHLLRSREMFDNPVTQGFAILHGVTGVFAGMAAAVWFLPVRWPGYVLESIFVGNTLVTLILHNHKNRLGLLQLTLSQWAPVHQSCLVTYGSDESRAEAYEAGLDMLNAWFDLMEYAGPVPQSLRSALAQFVYEGKTFEGIVSDCPDEPDASAVVLMALELSRYTSQRVLSPWLLGFFEDPFQDKWNYVIRRSDTAKRHLDTRVFTDDLLVDFLETACQEYDRVIISMRMSA